MRAARAHLSSNVAKTTTLLPSHTTDNQQAFLARGLQARVEARLQGEYVSADEMLARLDAVLAAARIRSSRTNCFPLKREG